MGARSDGGADRGMAGSAGARTGWVPRSAVIAAVRAGGIVRFDCGPKPVTIRMNPTAKVRNTSARVVLDGQGLITPSGEGRHRILYMDTCDRAQVWTASHCQDQRAVRSSTGAGACASLPRCSPATAATTTGLTPEAVR